MSTPVTCPHCDTTFQVRLGASIASEQRFTMRLTPAPGAKMQARTIGESIAAIGKLHAAVSKEHGIVTTTLVDRIDTAEDGAVTIELLLLSSPATVA